MSGSLRPLQSAEDLHPTLRSLWAACAAHDLSSVVAIVESWMVDRFPPGPPDHPIDALEPAFFLAIRLNDAETVSYFLKVGMSPSRLAIYEALEARCSAPVWQAFIDHGWDINASLDHKQAPPLGYDFVSSSWPALP